MAAIGFVLVAAGLLYAICRGPKMHYAWNKADSAAAWVLMFGTVLLVAGTAIKLWQVMP